MDPNSYALFCLLRFLPSYEEILLALSELVALIKLDRLMRSSSLITAERIERRIFYLRGVKVMLSSDLAELYGVAVKALNQAVRRNLVRFPEDFMFQLTPEEFEDLKSQIVTSRFQGRFVLFVIFRVFRAVSWIVFYAALR